MTSSGRPGVDYIGVGVGAVIVNERREVLLLLRKKAPEAEQWTIPGGTVEWFESCEDAIRRECREEVALDIKIEKLLTVVDHIVEADAAHWVSLEYLATITSNCAPVIEEAESREMKWFSLDALPNRMTQPTQEALHIYKLTVDDDG